MLLQVQPVVDCVQAVRAMTDDPGELILLTPQGTALRQPMVRQMANCRRLLLLCGRYEGFDQRVIDILKPQEISLGDFILNGGEIAAMAIVESVIRLVPGFMGDQKSCQQESFTDSDLLEFPQYTRPRDFRGYCVPEVLLSGNHQQIAAWREQQRLLRTAQRRQDLLSNQDISADSP
jgi:tRNA (guanine37-N1)-methyltransferase